MNYEQKYLKYKEKYLELKKMKAGYRIMNPGPMIGYPAMPYMTPQVRVSGPIPTGPFGPRFGAMPGPFILGPRMIRVTESESPKCPSYSAPSYKVFAIFDKAQLKPYYRNEDFKILILDTPDKNYRDLVAKTAGLAAITPKIDYSGTNNESIKFTFNFGGIPCMTNADAKIIEYTALLATPPVALGKVAPIALTFTLLAQD